MRVTFDTNTIDRAISPKSSANNDFHPDDQIIHHALLDKKIQGFFSETMVTIEGIKRSDRATVLGNTTLSIKTNPLQTEFADEYLRDIRLLVEQPGRGNLPELFRKRINTARVIGMKCLKTPRIGAIRIDDTEGVFFHQEHSLSEVSKRLQTQQCVLRDIELRGVGFVQIKKLAANYFKLNEPYEPWYKSLLRASSGREIDKVARAFAEWADGDSVAAHVAYGIDVFCSHDFGKSAGTPSILDLENRAWLSAEYGMKFASLSELAEMLK